MILSACFFLLGWVIAVLLTPSVIRICQRGFGLDGPNETRKTQAVPIPRLGGAPIVIAALAGLALNFWIDPKATVNWAPVLVGSLLMYGLGFWDDLKPLGAREETDRPDSHRLPRLVDGAEHRQGQLPRRPVVGTTRRLELLRHRLLAHRGAEYHQSDRRLRRLASGLGWCSR
jgi:hypothetical protein